MKQRATTDNSCVGTSVITILWADGLIFPQPPTNFEKPSPSVESVSSLTDRSISRSDSVLLTHL